MQWLQVPMDSVYYGEELPEKGADDQDGDQQGNA